jgi:protein O-mannosyl-transferase
MRPHGLAIAAIWLALLVVYSDSFGGGLVLDNAPIIAHDPRITALTSENVRRIWTSEYWFTQTGNGLYRPLTTLSYLFNYSILGNADRPAGYHWINYALHAVNASLLYLLGLGIFRRRIAPAFVLAIVWAMHPVLTESVTNIIGRADLLAGFGIVAGLLCYRRGLEDPLRRWAWFGAAALAVAAGVWSKESAIISPMVAVVYDLCFPSEAPGRARLWGYGCLTLPCLLYFLARPDIAPLHIPFTDNPLVGADFWTARLTAFKVIGKYIALLLFPRRLSSDYSYHQIPVDVDWQVAAALAACIAIAGLAVYGWRKDRRWFFFIALGAIGLAPTANLAKLIGTIMAERFLYVPAMGFAGCLVLTILAVSRRFPNPEQVFAVAVTVFCLAFGWRTYARNLDWADQRSMSQAMVAAAPGSYKGHAFYFGSLDDSVRDVEVALRILQGLPDEQNSGVAYINAGKWFRDKGQTLASAAPSESAA